MRVPGLSDLRRSRRSWWAGGVVVLVVVVGLILVLRGGEDPSSAGPGPWFAEPALDRAVAAVRDEAHGAETVSGIRIERSRIVASYVDASGDVPNVRTVRAGPDGRLREVDVTTVDDYGVVDPGVGVQTQLLDPVGAEDVIEAARRGARPASAGAGAVRVQRIWMNPGARDADGAEWQVRLAGVVYDDRDWMGSLSGRRTVRGEGAPAPLPGDDGPVTAVSGLGARSLLRPAQLRAALREVARRGTGLPVLDLTVRPGRFVASLQVSDGEPSGYSVAVRPTLLVRTSSEPGDGREPVADLGAIDPDGPAAALRTIAARPGGPSPDRVSLVTAVRRGETGTGWLLVYDADTSTEQEWTARGDGSGVARRGGGD